jgi:hypothetical protein
MVNSKWLAGLLGAALVLACSSESENCGNLGTAFVAAIVTDSVSGARICDATVSVRVGALDYQMTVGGDPCSYSGFRGELNAEHTVTVSKAGYQTFSRTVTVAEGKCGPKTQTIEAALRPE